MEFQCWQNYQTQIHVNFVANAWATSNTLPILPWATFKVWSIYDTNTWSLASSNVNAFIEPIHCQMGMHCQHYRMQTHVIVSLTKFTKHVHIDCVSTLLCMLLWNFWWSWSPWAQPADCLARLMTNWVNHKNFTRWNSVDHTAWRCIRIWQCVCIR